MEFSDFYNQCQSLPDADRQWVDAFYSTVIEVFGEEPNFTDLHKVCRLFYGEKTAKLSKAQYYRKRKLIIKLYEWLATQGKVSQDFLQKVCELKIQDVLSDDELLRHYFKNIDEALNFVTSVGLYKGLGDYDDLLFIKSIVILSWYQLSTTEMVELQKSSLMPQTSEVVIGDKRIQIEEKYFGILRRFAELDMHKGFPSQKKQIYLPSRFLFRTAQRPQLCANNLKKALERFNTVAVERGRELSLISLRRNGVFCKVYVSESDDKSVGVLIQEICKCDTAFACGYKKLYERWKIVIVGGDDN